MMQSHRQSVDVSRIRPRLGGLPHLETFKWQTFDPGWEGSSVYLSCKRVQIKMSEYSETV